MSRKEDLLNALVFLFAIIFFFAVLYLGYKMPLKRSDGGFDNGGILSGQG